MLCRACIATRVLVCAGFALGKLGSMACPANYFRIVTEDVCRSAAAAAGQAYQGRETSIVFPQGCYMNEGLDVFLNDATGASGTKSKLLCSGAFPFTTVVWALVGCWVLTRALIGYRGLC